MTIFLVKSNLNHDTDKFLAGSFMEGDQGRFQSLVNDGVLEVVEGAETFEEAAEIVAKKAEAAEEAAQEEEANKPQDTWAATPEEEKTEDAPAPENKETPAEEKPADAEEYTGPMGKYKITGEAFYTDTEGNRAGTLEIGSVQELPKPIGDTFVEKGVAEEVAETPATDGADVDTNL